MTLFWTIATIIGVLVVLVISHGVVWLRGYEAGQRVVRLEGQIERLKGMKGEQL